MNDLKNLGDSPLELDFAGDIDDLPEGAKCDSGRVTVMPGETIPQVVWDALPTTKQDYLRQTGHIAKAA